MLDWQHLPRPIVALAPMADMTDLPFCLLCKEHGAPIMFREMVSSEAVVRLNPKTLRMCEFDPRERPIVQQIFGSDPSVMAEAARIIEERFQPDAIDINMGCPVYNLVSNFNGAFLIKEPERASAIIKAMRAAVSVPISVKTRLGWSKDTDVLEFVKVLEDAGTALISIHGRTKEQGYSGKANWDRIGEARANTSLPVLVNGDIVTLDDAKDALKRSNADGVLIGRGSLGNPWFFEQLVRGLRDQSTIPEPSLEERVNVVRQHAALQLQHHGPHGLTKLRKHLPWYFKRVPGLKGIKEDLVRISSLEDLEKAFSKHIPSAL